MSDAVPRLTLAATLAGQADGFERLWTPHRMAYIDGQARPVPGATGDCPFCQAPTKTDAESLIVARGQTVFVILNLFPYNPGHLLVCPYRHIADLTEASQAETAELMACTQRAMRTLRLVSNPAGFNLGINQGAVAGAGISAHLHLHVVPRWSGDANFFPIVAQTKAVPELLGQTHQRLAQAWVGTEETVLEGEALC